jgi:integrase/recombinase XerC
MMLHHAAEEWLTERLGDGDISKATHQSYESSMRLFVRNVGGVQIADVTPAMIRTWTSSMRMRGNEPATIYNRLTALRSFYRWCYRREYVTANPCDAVANPKLTKNQQVRNLDQYEVETVLSSIDDKATRLIVLLGLYCGLRRAEIAGLQTDYVNLRTKQLVVLGKGNRQRTLPIPAGLVPDLTDWMGTCAGVRWVFPSRKGDHLHPATVGRMVSDAARSALGKRCTLHQFRHTAAVDVLTATHDVAIVQQMLGHSNIATTNRYIGKVTTHLADAMEGRKYGDAA